MSPTLKLLKEAERAAALVADTLDLAADSNPHLVRNVRALATQARLLLFAVRGQRLTCADPVGAILAKPDLTVESVMCAHPGCDDQPRLGSPFCYGHHAERAARTDAEVPRG